MMGEKCKLNRFELENTINCMIQTWMDDDAVLNMRVSHPWTREKVVIQLQCMCWDAIIRWDHPPGQLEVISNEPSCCLEVFSAHSLCLMRANPNLFFFFSWHQLDLPVGMFFPYGGSRYTVETLRDTETDRYTQLADKIESGIYFGFGCSYGQLFAFQLKLLRKWIIYIFHTLFQLLSIIDCFIIREVEEADPRFLFQEYTFIR